MINQNYRLRELDFLRGIAIILVLLRHQYLFSYGYTMGWIGVDLFFVLSGFLVSGLLFKEYIKFGNIKPKLFLIRRGFKIYPIYYLFYPLYLVPLFLKKQIDFKGIISDLFFIQNYVMGWGYAYVASWSLAVEEHFYILFSILFWLTYTYMPAEFKKSLRKKNGFKIVVIILFLICLVVRIHDNILNYDSVTKNFTMTHLRIDSLLAGVFVSYIYYFEKDRAKDFFLKYKYGILCLIFLQLSFTPFLDPDTSFFVRTFGFTFLYLAFSLLLCCFLFEEKIGIILDNFFSRKVVSAIATIGVSSYSIYIIHTLVNTLLSYINVYIFGRQLNQILIFFISTFGSVFLGIVMTNNIEKYFLRLREKHFPNRIT